MAKKTQTSTDAAPVAEGPVVFIGAPTACQASIPFRNTTDRKLKLKGLAVRAPELAPEDGELQPRFKARLGPHQSASLPVRLPLGRFTPPGVYDATVEVSGHETKSEIHVLEHRTARALPSRLRLRGRSGGEIERTVLLENTGNVPFELASATRVSIEQQHWMGRAAVVSLRSFEGDSFDELMSAVTRELRSSLPEPVEIRVDPGGDAELQPGESRKLVLRITLPEDLELGREYHGGCDLGPTRVGLTVECTGQVPVRKGSARTRKGTPRKETRSAKPSQTKKPASRKKATRPSKSSTSSKRSKS